MSQLYRRSHRPSVANTGSLAGPAVPGDLTGTAGSTFRARGALAHLAGFAAFGLGVSSLYAFTGVGFPCPFRLLTGWDCPLCGGTRLGSALLHGDLGAAYAYNPLVFVGLIGMAVLGLAWSIEALGGPALRPSPLWRRRLSSIRPTHWLLMGSALAVVYTLVRNLI